MQTEGVIRDNNHVPIWWGISSVDGTTLEPILIDSVTGKLKMEYGISTMPIMSSLPTFFDRDANHIPCLGGVSSAVATTIIPVSVNPLTGAIQAQLT